MKTMFVVPPCNSDKGVAQATQNRQAQYFKDPTFIYPIIPALFISMLLDKAGEAALWVDCVAEDETEESFFDLLKQSKPDFIVLESNTMLFHKYCEFIGKVKVEAPGVKVVLCGEHVTALPEEGKKTKADHVIQGGKWYKDVYKLIVGEAWPDKPLPKINRQATRWWLYAYANGNFKYLPATYTMFSFDCWYRPGSGACTFCTWVDYHPENMIRPVEECLDEVEYLIQCGFREFFDDSGTFPVGKWLHTFCTEMIERGYNKHIVWGCNMRFNALQPKDFALMRQAGCRFILWGFESANQSTLDHLKKGYDIKDVAKSLYPASKEGIWNHLTVMTGYHWEELEEERRTFNMVKYLLLEGFASSMQSTIFQCYPGTESFKEAKEKGLIVTEDWSRWTMLEPTVKLKYPFEEVLKMQRDYYNISYHPKFIFNKIKSIRNIDDLKFYGRLFKKVFNRFEGLTFVGK